MRLWGLLVPVRLAQKNCPMLFENKLGGKVAVFAGIAGNKPQFMCELHKDLYARVLNAIAPMIAYYAGYAEVYAQAGKTEDGTVVLYLVNIGLDTEEKIAIKTAKEFSEILALSPNGECRKFLSLAKTAKLS